jgi:hypothetical protein
VRLIDSVTLGDEDDEDRLRAAVGRATDGEHHAASDG